MLAVRVTGMLLTLALHLSSRFGAGPKFYAIAGADMRGDESTLCMNMQKARRAPARTGPPL